MENAQLNPEITAVKDAFIKRQPCSDIEIALASYTVLDQYRWVPYPSIPEMVAKYFAYTMDTRIKMNKEPEKYREFWHAPEVIKYFDTKVKVKNQNERNKSWLTWMKKVLCETHPDKEVAINVKLYQFTDDYNEAFKVEQPDWGQ